MPTPYPDPIPQIAKVIIDEVEKHFPGLTKRNLDSHGFPSPDGGSPAQDRAEFCVYIELMKAGAWNHLLGVKNENLHENG